MVRLRREQDAGESNDPRTRLRALARAFPGSLRELDSIPMEELVRRWAHLVAVESGAPPEPWVALSARYHALLRETLAGRAGRGEARGRPTIAALDALRRETGVDIARLRAVLFAFEPSATGTSKDGLGARARGTRPAAAAAAASAASAAAASTGTAACALRFRRSRCACSPVTALLRRRVEVGIPAPPFQDEVSPRNLPFRRLFVALRTGVERGRGDALLFLPGISASGARVFVGRHGFLCGLRGPSRINFVR